MTTLAESPSAILKEATREAHESLDATLGARLRDDPEGAIERLLVASYAMVLAWEPRLRAIDWPGTLDVGRRLQKRSWLEADLGRADGASLAPPLPPLRPAEAWGALYVMEGSTLGAMFLRRSASQRARSSRYLAAYGDDTGAMWNTFRRHLNQAITTNEQLEDAVRVARSLFAEVAAAIETDGVHHDHPDRRPHEL